MITNIKLKEYYNKAINEYPQVKEIPFNDLKSLVRIKEKHWLHKNNEAITYNNVLSVFDDLMTTLNGLEVKR